MTINKRERKKERKRNINIHKYVYFIVANMVVVLIDAFVPYNQLHRWLMFPFASTLDLEMSLDSYCLDDRPISLLHVDVNKQLSGSNYVLKKR